MMNYSRAIRMLRAVLGMSQQELASKVDLSSSLLSRIEAGDRKLSKKNKLKMAVALGITPSLIDLFALDPSKSKLNEDEIKKLGQAIVDVSKVVNEEAS